MAYPVENRRLTILSSCFWGRGHGFGGDEDGATDIAIARPLLQAGLQSLRLSNFDLASSPEEVNRSGFTG
jgi:hypothetical protein